MTLLQFHTNFAKALKNGRGSDSGDSESFVICTNHLKLIVESDLTIVKRHADDKSVEGYLVFLL